MEIEITDTTAIQALELLKAKTGNLAGAMAVIGRFMLTQVQMEFRQGKDPYGTPWKPLSKTTIERRRKGKGKPGAGAGGVQILKDTGRLAASFTYDADAESVTVGTNVSYAKTHQFGAAMGQYGRYYQLARLKFAKGDFRRAAGSKKGHPIPWGNIPARPFLPTHGLPGAWKDGINHALTAHLMRTH